MGNPEREESESPNAEHEQFEFWMVGNPLPSFPQPQHLLTADQLFADGIILPLHSHSHSHSLDNDDDQHNSPLPPLPHSSIVPPPPNYSIKKWKHINIFATRPKQNMKKPKNNSNNNSGSVSSCNSTTATATAAAAAAAAADQLNIIHIWPFSRSRSTGTRPATTSSSTKARFHNYVKARAGRKASSAPCSRSNSRGDQQQQEKEEFSNSHRDQPEEKEESSSVETTTTTEAATAPPPPPPPPTTVKKKWGPLVGGMGVRVRRSMPVWQMRRGSRSGNSSSCENNESSKTLLNHLNVSSTCIGYESSNGSSSSSCGSENKDGVTEGEANGDGTAATAAAGGGGGGGASGGLFSLKGIFSKKV